MNEWFLSILIDPETGESLEYIREENVMAGTESKRQFQVVEYIPIILDNSEGLHLRQPLLHEAFSTSFKYREHYQTDAEVFDYRQERSREIMQENRRLHEAIIEKIPDTCRLILDVGCGNGWVAEMLLPKGKRVISMDISTVNPLKALRNNSHENHNGLVADVYKLPVRDKSIDCIIASEIIEHVPDPKLFISCLLEKLKPEGRLVITTPYNEKVEFFLCVHCNKPTPRDGHIHTFTETNIKSLLPEEISCEIDIVNNRYLFGRKISSIVTPLPYKAWKRLDKIANRIPGHALKLRLVIKKA